MKKIFSFLTSSVIAACSLAAFGANAEEIGNYKPRLYFKTEKNPDVQVLPGGTIYIDKSTLNNNEPIVIDSSVYIEDDLKLAGNVIAKFKSESEFVRLDNLTCEAPLPYSNFKEPSDAVLKPEENLISVQYYMIGTSPMSLTGENSDDYPLASFNADVSADIPYGSYEIIFMNEGSGKRSEILYRTADIAKIGPTFYPGEYCEGIRINVSDRMLGDIDNNGAVDSVDASAALTEYARLSSNQASMFDSSQTQAADVDGNGAVDAVDASTILSYYAYRSTTGTLDLIDYLYERSL